MRKTIINLLGGQPHESTAEVEYSPIVLVGYKLFPDTPQYQKNIMDIRMLIGNIADEQKRKLLLEKSNKAITQIAKGKFGMADYMDFFDQAEKGLSLSHRTLQELLKAGNSTSFKSDLDRVAEALANEQFAVYRTMDVWPRDSFVERNDVILKAPKKNPIGEGGNYINGGDFFFINKDLESELSELSNKQGSLRDFAKGDIYGIDLSNVKPHVRGDPKVRPYEHIDLFMGYLPSQKLILAHQLLYKHNKAVIDNAVKNHKLQLDISVSPQITPRYSFPHNFTTFYNPKGEFVLANDEMSFPEGLGINFVRLEADALSKNMGSVRCATNQLDSPELLKALGIKAIPQKYSV